MADPGRKSAPSAAKQALIELKRMQARLDAAEQARREPIAICGMGMRFPGGVDGAQSYWRLLSAGVDAITEVPASRWDVDSLYDPDPEAPGKMYCRHGGFLDAVQDFDAEFFGLSPREALSTDPQQRLLLEVSWEALEDAAIAPTSLAKSRSGVFIGMGNSDYSRMLIEEFDGIDAHTGTGGAMAVASGRLSYALGLNGPSVVIDTACSSSLTALALACESLRRRECDLALAGGTNLILTPEYNIAFCKARMLAFDGRCKTFDARADGYVRGEGCAVIVLKRLSDAIANDDPVLAVVRGVAVNQDGASSGLTVPNGPAQESVVRDALQNGGVAPEEVDYVEAHGTATSLGDPIEVHALGAVFANRAADRPLMIGSVKTNLGHLEAAAGMAGVIKVVLALQHEQIPPTLHFEQPSPQIDWSRCPVEVATRLTAWRSDGRPRRAGVSSFGFSGTNAHVVLEQAPQREVAETSARGGPAMLALSAKAPEALKVLAGRYADYFARRTASVEEVCWSANTGRSHLSHRLAAVAGTAQEMQERLEAFARGEDGPGCHAAEWFDSGPAPVAFLFTGDGSQWAGMGRGYYERYPRFREALDECDRLFRAHTGAGLVDRLFGQDAESGWSEPASFGQPALFSLQVAMARLWQSWGVECTAVLGHGLGEFAAACIAGVFDLEEGLALTAARGRLYDGAADAEIAAVLAPVDAVRPLLQGAVDDAWVVAENGPRHTVVAGTSGTLSALSQQLRDGGVEIRAMGTAAWTPPADGIEYERLQHAAAGIEYSVPAIAMASARFGRLVDRDVCTPSAWMPEPRAAIKFHAALQSLSDDGQRDFLEIGPHPVLLPIARQALPGRRNAWHASARRGENDVAVAYDTLAALYTRGVEPDWQAFEPEHPRRRIALPTYPFQREPYWWSAGRDAPASVETPRRWPGVVAEGRRQAEMAPMGMDIGAYPDKWRKLEALTNAYLVDAFRSLGLFAAEGETHTADSLVAAAGIKPVYTMLMSRWLGYLAEAGVLERMDDRYRARQALRAPETAALLTAARRSLSDIPELMEYIERCGEMLADVLLDRESALQTLFPDGATDTARFLYRDWAAPRYFHEIGAAVVKRAVDTLAPHRCARLIEIGAGTGATTSYVLPRLDARNTEYCFTDVSDYFLSQAGEEFADYPFVRYGQLDIGRSPREQGYGEHGFDVVIAANVLHATSDLGGTVDHVLSLLAPGGILVLYETTGAPRWSDMTVSLIEGWQSFADDLRTDSPLLSSEQWIALLRDRGFDDAVALPGAGSAASILGSEVIVAHVDEQRELRAGEAPAAAEPAPETARAREPAGGESGLDPAAVAELRRRLDEVAPNERADLLVDYVRGCVNRVLRRNPDKPLDRRQRLMDLGVDSLMAVELRNVLTLGLGLAEPLPATLIFDQPTIEAVASFLDSQLDDECGPVPEADTPAGASESAMSETDVDALSDEEVKAALRAKIGEV